MLTFSDISDKRNEFVAMALSGDLEGIRQEVETNPDKVNSLYGEETQLTAACLGGRMEIVKFLLASRADVNVSNEHGNTPLHYSLNGFYGDLPFLLLHARANASARNNKGWNALHMAASKSRSDVIEELIKCVDINALNFDKMSALYLASVREDQPVRILVEARADMSLSDNEGLSPLYVAAKHNNEEAVRHLVSGRADVNQRRYSGESPQYIAAFNGNEAIVDILMNANARPDLANDSGQLPLYAACLYGHTAVFKKLVDYKLSSLHQVMTQPLSKTLLHIASTNGYLDIMEVILTKCMSGLSEQQEEDK